MDVVFLRKSLALIAKGLVEKEECLRVDPRKYPHSPAFHHGMNLFLASRKNLGKVPDPFRFSDSSRTISETTFLSHYCVMPISDWFSDWDQDAVTSLHLENEVFYGCGAFLVMIGTPEEMDAYIVSEECYEYLEMQDDDIIDGTDERGLYVLMIKLDQASYVRLRSYIIKHPVISAEEWQRVMNEAADNPSYREAFRFAYEKVEEDCCRCPVCGWTMVKKGNQYYCPFDGIQTPAKTSYLYAERSFFRLKRGVMRYIAIPGRDELDVVALCEKKGLSWALWPEMDRYDVEIRFPDGAVWEIDVKAYRNALFLKNQIEEDGGFPDGSYEKGYFVIPSRLTLGKKNYMRVINRVLHQDNVECISFNSLRRKIAERLEVCREQRND